jgi:hypothetical protein
MKHTILILLCLLTVVAGGLSLFRQRDHQPQNTAALIGGSYTLIDQESVSHLLHLIPLTA